MEPSFTKIQRNTNIDPDHIYYNVSMANGNLSGGSENDPQIRFFEARDRPIVRDASKYEMSVIKFNINGASKNLPLLIPQLAPAMSATAVQSGTLVTVTTSGGHGLRATTGRLTRITLGIVQLTFAPNPITFSSNIDGVYAITVTDFNKFTFTAPVSQNVNWTTLVPNAVYSYEKTCYTLTMTRTYNAGAGINHFSLPIYWSPETDAPLPASPPNTMDIATNDYFYVYHYGHWLGLVNTTIANIASSVNGVPSTSTATLVTATSGTNVVSFSAYSSAASTPLYIGMPVEVGFTTGTSVTGYITTLSSTTAGTITTTTNLGVVTGPITLLKPRLYTNISQSANFSVFPPNNADADGTNPRLKFAWDATTKLMNIYANTASWPVTPSRAGFTGSYTFYYNTNFESLFTGWHNQYTQANLNYEHQLNFNNASDGQLNIWSIPSGYPVGASSLDWVLTQECNSTSTLWCPVDSIVFTSTNIPVRNEEGSAPIIYGQTNLASHGGSGSFGTIISEITKEMTDASDWRQFVFYQPTAQYQIASLDGNDVEIRNIDIFVWWKSRLTGQLVPLRLYNGGSASMKILFRKK